MNLQKLGVLALVFLLCSHCGSDNNKPQVQAVSSSAQSSKSSVPNSTDLAQKINAYMEENISDKDPGMAVLISKNGKTFYSATRGMSDIPAGVPISSHTGFCLASISKPFTAIAILQLVEKGQLQLSDSVLSHIPELPVSWKNVTIDLLLSHRSGVKDIENSGWDYERNNGMNTKKLLNYLKQSPSLDFEPGTNWNYSNTGFMLLAIVVERVTGMSFGQYMNAYVFAPAGMSNSYIYDENQPLKAGDALHYGKLRTAYGISGYFKGGSDQISSIDDFANFFIALQQQRLLSSEYFSIMTQSRAKLSGVDAGYGIFIFSDYLGHEGQWDAFENIMRIARQGEVSWIVLTNSGAAGRVHADTISSMISSAKL